MLNKLITSAASMLVFCEHGFELCAECGYSCNHHDDANGKSRKGCVHYRTKLLVDDNMGPRSADKTNHADPHAVPSIAAPMIQGAH
mmetsp:Transcript_49506/g.130581  ORF Transcript_49506/g.130581 Transcript_49506/m.130581 type:complete len:86 (+) Transcript_49506:109-366(+)